MVGTAIFVVAMVLQFRARRYQVWIYWFAVAMVAVWGTLAADGMHIKLGVPYALSSAFFAVCLAVVFAAWYATEHTLSIHSITTRAGSCSTGPPCSPRSPSAPRSAT